MKKGKKKNNFLGFFKSYNFWSIFVFVVVILSFILGLFGHTVLLVLSFIAASIWLIVDYVRERS